MKSFLSRSREAAAKRNVEHAETPGAEIDDRRRGTAVQRRLAEVAQRAGMEEEEPLQRAGMEEEEPLQRAGLEEEEPLQRAGMEEEEPLQRAGMEEEEPMQRKAASGGLPGNLQAGIENLSGIAMDDVRVHYNSAAPAQVQAHAYTQGSDIHVAPGQEKHLAHEAWHVVQQKQGRVQPTLQMKTGVQVNDDAGLEHEADVMGARALQAGDAVPLQLHAIAVGIGAPVLQAKGWTWNGATWVPDSGANFPQPPVVGSVVGARYVSLDPETVDDVVSDCPNTPLSIGDYNRGRNYAVGAFGFHGHPAHSSNSVHLNPRTRLREMGDAGASVAQLREVRRLWGI